MNAKKDETQIMHLQVAEGLIVEVLPDEQHEFLIPTKDVAIGYGVSETTFRRHKQEHSDDLIEGKHFVTIVRNLNAGCKSGIYNTPPVKRTYWTKRGVVRMGFFIRSERAKLFRDWAEDLIINTIDRKKMEISHREVEKLNKMAFRAMQIAGSYGKLARVIGINKAIFTHLQVNPHLVSDKMRNRIEEACTNIIRYNTVLDNGTVSLLMKIEDKKLRLELWNRLADKKGGTL